MKATQSLPMLLVLLAIGAPMVSARESEENPLRKVIELMDSLATKITKEGQAEAKAYAEFVEWCDDAATNKKFEIKTATSKKEQLEATIGKTTADSGASAAKIEELAGSIATAQADLKSATAIREKEFTDFGASEVELMDVIDTLGRAISIVEREMAKNPAAFAQVDTTNLNSLVSSLSTVVDAAAFSSADKQKLLALVQSQQGAGADDAELAPPAAAVYKTHSTGIVDVLEDLKEKAEEQLSGLRKAETNAKHNYEMLKQSLEDQTKADTGDMDEAQMAKASAEETKATAEGDLSSTVKDLANANEALATANTNCMQTAADHEATVAARAEELKAIADAKQVLTETSSGAVSKTYSMLQLQQSTLVGLRLRTRADLANAEIVNLVKRLAAQQHSAALAQLASRIAAVMRFGASAGEDPFAKVKGLITEMISKLLAEAGSEATEKAYCDEQIAKTEEKKSELNSDMSKLTAKIDQAAAKSAGLKEEVKELQAELAAMAKQQAEMDKIRKESHAAYVEAKADLELGLEGVRKALGVLREYYGSSTAAAAMLQGGDSIGTLMQQPALPEQHSKATGAGTSIIGLLEVVESDFAKNLAKEEMEESDAATEYEKMSQENKVTKTLKDQDVKYKTQEFKSLDKSISELSVDRETAGTELSAVLEYYDKIKARCIAMPETYEARKGRREAEIKGLKEAMAILEDETALVQRSKRGRRGHFLGMSQP